MSASARVREQGELHNVWVSLPNSYAKDWWRLSRRCTKTDCNVRWTYGVRAVQGYTTPSYLMTWKQLSKNKKARSRGYKKLMWSVTKLAIKLRKGLSFTSFEICSLGFSSKTENTKRKWRKSSSKSHGGTTCLLKYTTVDKTTIWLSQTFTD